MFVHNEKVVYPGHGVAHIYRVLDRRIGGLVTKFYELKFVNKDMTILVPVDNMETIGIRRLSSQKDIDYIGTFLASRHTPEYDAQPNWTKRNKEYLCKMRSGKLYEMCEIYRDLTYIQLMKELSFGEKSLLHQAELLLAEEMAFVYSLDPDAAMQRLRVWSKEIE